MELNKNTRSFPEDSLAFLLRLLEITFFLLHLATHRWNRAKTGRWFAAGDRATEERSKRKSIFKPHQRENNAACLVWILYNLWKIWILITIKLFKCHFKFLVQRLLLNYLCLWVKVVVTSGSIKCWSCLTSIDGWEYMISISFFIYFRINYGTLCFILHFI